MRDHKLAQDVCQDAPHRTDGMCREETRRVHESRSNIRHTLQTPSPEMNEMKTSKQLSSTKNEDPANAPHLHDHKPTRHSGNIRFTTKKPLVIPPKQQPHRTHDNTTLKNRELLQEDELLIPFCARTWSSTTFLANPEYGVTDGMPLEVTRCRVNLRSFL